MNKRHSTRNPAKKKRRGEILVLRTFADAQLELYDAERRLSAPSRFEVGFLPQESVADGVIPPVWLEMGTLEPGEPPRCVGVRVESRAKGMRRNRKAVMPS